MIRRYRNHEPDSRCFVVHTAFGIPGSSELTDSSISKPCRSILNVLRGPRPQAVKIWGVSEFGRTFITFESMIGFNDSSSSAKTRFSSGRGRKCVWGSGEVGSDMPNEGYDVELNSGSSSSSPNFWNWYRWLKVNFINIKGHRTEDQVLTDFQTRKQRKGNQI